MKALRREEQKQGAELMSKIRLQWDQIDERFRAEEEECKRKYETDIESMSRYQKREMEKLELNQNNELRQELKKLKIDQVRLFYFLLFLGSGSGTFLQHNHIE